MRLPCNTRPRFLPVRSGPRQWFCVVLPVAQPPAPTTHHRHHHPSPVLQGPPAEALGLIVEGHDLPVEVLDLPVEISEGHALPVEVLILWTALP